MKFKKMKVTAAATLFLSLLMCSIMVEASPALDGAGPPTSQSPFCNAKCGVRCSAASRKDRCLEYCGICCSKCGCVPSGTYGNRDECPCYRDLKNSKGQAKCP